MEAHAAAGNNHFGTGSFGGTVSNFRWEVTSRNLKKGTFSLVIRQGNDTLKRKQILETHSNLSFDPKSPDYILKRIGNEKNTITVEGSQAFIQPVGEYPNKSAYVRVSDLPDANKTPDYLDENGDINTEYSSSATNYFPALGSGSYGGAFGDGKDISAGNFMGATTHRQTPGDFGSEIAHPFLFYDNIATANSQGVDVSAITSGKSAYPVQAAAVGGGTVDNTETNSKLDKIANLLVANTEQNKQYHSSAADRAVQQGRQTGKQFGRLATAF